MERKQAGINMVGQVRYSRVVVLRTGGRQSIGKAKLSRRWPAAASVALRCYPTVSKAVASLFRWGRAGLANGRMTAGSRRVNGGSIAFGVSESTSVGVDGRNSDDWS